MAVRVSPYLIASIDWTDPYDDPIRRHSSRSLAARPDHPRLTFDSLHEQHDSPVPGLIHRYADKALFLASANLPGVLPLLHALVRDRPRYRTASTSSARQRPPKSGKAFAYIAAHPELEDIVISGGDTYQLAPKNIALIGDALLAIPHVRRMRFATKGLAVMPMKILTDQAWIDALVGVVERGAKIGQRSRGPHALQPVPTKSRWITQQAMSVLFERGIYVRNQTRSHARRQR